MASASYPMGRKIILMHHNRIELDRTNQFVFRPIQPIFCLKHRRLMVNFSPLEVTSILCAAEYQYLEQRTKYLFSFALDVSMVSRIKDKCVLLPGQS